MIAHLIRGFVQPTETFIVNQVKNIKIFEQKVYCHHEIFNPIKNQIPLFSLINNLEGIMKKKEEFLYKNFRYLSEYAAKMIHEDLVKENIKLIHLHYLTDARYFLKVYKNLKLPTVVSVYGYDVSRFPNSFGGYGKKYLSPIFEAIDIFLAMSEDMKNDLISIGCPEKKIIVHYYGTEIDKYQYCKRQYLEKSHIKLLYCGRLTGKKNPLGLIKALQAVQKRGINLPEWSITFVGDGELRTELETYVNLNKLTAKVSILGHIPYDDPRHRQMYFDSDIFILPSRIHNNDKEGIPGTLIEAMASGLPVISTYHAGIPSVIVNEYEGILVEQNNIMDLAEAIIKLMGSVELREKLGRAAAIKAIDNLDINAKTHELELIYDKILHDISIDKMKKN